MNSLDPFRAAAAEMKRRVADRHPGFIATEDASRMIELCEEALETAQKEIWALRGELAARDGRETILTFDRIGTEGVPVNHPEGTILACTDSDRKWRLTDGKWAPLPFTGLSSQPA